MHHFLNPVFHSVANIDSVTLAGGSFSAFKFPLIISSGEGQEPEQKFVVLMFSTPVLRGYSTEEN